MNYKTYHSGPLIALRYLQKRGAKRKLFVLCFDEELGTFEVSPIEWAAARALAPDHVAELGHLMATDPFMDEVDKLLAQSAQSPAT